MDTIAPVTLNRLRSIDCFMVERLRTARRFIAKAQHPKAIDDLVFFEYDKRDPESGVADFLERLLQGQDVGLLSEAGYPCVADPGKLAVMYAHENGIRVVPLIGPSSILLALTSSGFSGQQFCFHGYLPSKKGDLSQALKRICQDVQRKGSTQIFMETPYRNSSLLQSCIDVLPAHQKLCIACDINADTESIRTMTLKQWKQIDPQQFHKRPAIFLLGE